ncbi:putative Transcriptional regulator, LysR family [Paraburkholderia piptadeniae]|uniref:Transcriptional regulator, LysR family n=1 Tax=Paraburkholderia piptadeniae TaxID=1701573 RepID=A0A1N7RVT7_9BURK|nr:LysR family transcriptional regulator [Paraburkholderia piptadeniae]SIT39218.1 putative Transcriptional regulator, LysR family [Paraburkholderia piptadeniae]
MLKLKQVTDLELRLLRSFTEIVDRGGFAAAQAALNISQSVMSEHLKTLEVRLGFVLCKRGPGGFKLLPEGERVYKSAKQLFVSIDAFKADIGEIGDEMAGEVIVAVEDEIITNPACRLPEALQMFGVRAGRRARVQVEVMVGYQAISHVADGSVHLGISLSDVYTRDVSTQHLFDEVGEIYCGSGHPLFDVPDHEITEAQLAEYPYSSRGHLERKDALLIGNDFRSGDVGLGAQAQLALVLSGRDLGWVPQHVAAPSVAMHRARPVRPDITRRTVPINVVSRDAGPHGKLVALLRSCIVMAHTYGNPSEARPAGVSIAAVKG